MPKQIVADVFETLGGVVQGAGKQAASDVKKAGEDIKVELGISQAQGQPQDDIIASDQKDEQVKKMQENDKKKTISRYKQIQDEIRQIQEKRQREIPKAVSGKPGYDEGKVVKQLETGKPPEEEKKKLPPINVQRERTKAERFRGASG